MLVRLIHVVCVLLHSDEMQELRATASEQRLQWATQRMELEKQQEALQKKLKAVQDEYASRRERSGSGSTTGAPDAQLSSSQRRWAEEVIAQQSVIDRLTSENAGLTVEIDNLRQVPLFPHRNLMSSLSLSLSL